MTDDVRDAVCILENAYNKCLVGWTYYGDRWHYPRQMIANGIRHLSRPDRDIYPKSRRGTKTKPVMDRRQGW